MKSPEDVTLSDALELAERLSYKPGTGFSAKLHPCVDGVPEIVILILEYEGPSSTGDGDIRLTFQRPYGGADLMGEFQALIDFYEKHERDEWLKLDGRRLVDPHPELKPG